MFNKFPYTDLHNLNLDWFLDQFKLNQTKFKELEASFRELESEVVVVPIEVRQAIYNLLNNNAFANDNRYINDLAVLESWANESIAELTGISAVYTQSGTVYDTDSLDSLRNDLIVTALYDNGTTQTVTAYTLTGTLAEGTSTITVSYGGKTTTFNVIVTMDERIIWDYSMGLPDENGFTLAQSEDGSPSATLESDGVQMVIMGPVANYISYEYNTPTPDGVFEFQFKSGSVTNLNMVAHLATDSNGNGIGVRMQFSHSYKGIYLITGETISAMTLLKTMALNTVYTVKFVVNNGLVDTYVDNEKLSESVPVNSFYQNTATYFQLGSSSSSTASVNCKLISMSITG